MVARVVITHSTYLEGLIPLLKKIATADGIKTLIPGQINKVKGRCEKPRLKVSIQIEGGYKLIARRGSSTQEVFVITGLNRDQLKNIINQYNW